MQICAELCRSMQICADICVCVYIYIFIYICVYVCVCVRVCVCVCVCTSVLNFKKEVSKLVEDYPELSEKVKAGDFKRNDFEKIVYEYNRWKKINK